MRYWTIQKIEAYDKAIETGYLKGDQRYIEPYFLDKYHWLMQQMKNKLPNYSGEYPIWLWPKRPDLRRSGHMTPGERAILLEIEIEEIEVLLSEFLSWHIVLNNGTVTMNEAEEEKLDVGDLEISKEKSWERIFYTDIFYEGNEWLGKGDWQGTTGSIPIDKIVSTKIFTAK